MLSRRGLFALMGAAAAAPMAAVAAPRTATDVSEGALTSMAGAIEPDLTVRYAFTSYGRGYVVTERVAAATFDPRGHFHVGGYDAQGQRVTERLDA